MLNGSGLSAWHFPLIPRLQLGNASVCEAPASKTVATDGALGFDRPWLHSEALFEILGMIQTGASGKWANEGANLDTLYVGAIAKRELRRQVRSQAGA